MDTSKIPDSMIDTTTPVVDSSSTATPTTTRDSSETPLTPPPAPKRRRHNPNHKKRRRHQVSTLKVTRERSNRHKKFPETFDVEAVLRDGSIAIIRHTQTPRGWRDSIHKITFQSDTFETKRDLHTIVANEYIHCESPEEVLEWMKNDFSSVRLI